MEWIARRSELDDFEPEQRLAAVWCEDERHAEVDRDHPTAVMVLDEDDQAEAVASFFWGQADRECLDIRVVITTVARYLSDPGSGQITRLSIPLGDRLCFCYSCRKEYATLKPGVDPCWRCGALPDDE